MTARFSAIRRSSRSRSAAAAADASPERNRIFPMAAVRPRIRLDKKTAQKGDLVEVKTLVSHAMESGQRRDSAGAVVPRKIINKFTVELNDKPLFAADLEPAISANPYMQFKFKAQESGTLTFTWIDDDGTKITAEEKITVS